MKHRISRRDFIQQSSMAAMAFSVPFPKIPEFLNDYSMGVVVHSYGMRYGGRLKSEQYPPFLNALNLMKHCQKIGAGGVQAMVSGWDEDFVKMLRSESDQGGMYLEGSIGLPKDEGDVERFEREIKIAKEAGVSIFRTVCLNGRRYENFDSKNQFAEFKAHAIHSLELAEKVVRKHQVKLAVENHKDWKAAELVEILENLGSEWVGATVDFGNNVSLLEDPNEVIETLAPYAFSTHVKDMGVKEYEEGFLLSEVPLGEGIVDLKKGMDLCKKHNPSIHFSLEMITRDPLQIPCLTDHYWATFDNPSAVEFAQHLAMIRKHEFEGKLPETSPLTTDEKLALEEEHVKKSLSYSKNNLLT